MPPVPRKPCVVHLSGSQMWINGEEITAIVNMRFEMDANRMHTVRGTPIIGPGQITIDLTLMPDETHFGSPPPTAGTAVDHYDASQDTPGPKPSRKPRGVRRATNRDDDAKEKTEE